MLQLRIQRQQPLVAFDGAQQFSTQVHQKPHALRKH